MSGITEILLIAAIILGLFMLPRILSRSPEAVQRSRARNRPLSGRVRVAILASALWPALLAFFLEPWNRSWMLFFYAGAAPVALLWGIYWAFSGFKKQGR